MVGSTKPANRSAFRVAIICALEKESQTASALFEERYESADYGKGEKDTNTYTLGRIASHNVVLVHLPGPGKIAATTAAASLAFSFKNIKLALVVGVCGGVPTIHDQKPIVLGDIVISTGIVQYDFGRDNLVQRIQIDSPDRDLDLPRPTTEIRSFLAKLKADRDPLATETATHLEALLKQKGFEESQFPGANEDKLYNATYHHKHHQMEACQARGVKCSPYSICDDSRELTCAELGCAEENLVEWRRRVAPTETEKPTIHFGRIASSDTVMKSGEHRDKIAREEQFIALEMEGAGVWETFNCIVIKSVCDYADSHKNKAWQPYAAATAVACTKTCLKIWVSVDPEAGQQVKEEGHYMHMIGENNVVAQQGDGAINNQQRENAVFQGDHASYHRSA
ncbi:hypothetical protein AA313_de0206110 [Arthrobotrys entomopaga]|nr:hypothetical protein AA313_de0206110 [Arthrobotrys entomopaga]